MMIRRFLAALILATALAHPAGAQLFNPSGSGASGRGVSSVAINGGGHLIVTYSDATTTDAGLVIGTAGATGATGPAGATGATGPAGTFTCGAGLTAITGGCAVNSVAPTPGTGSPTTATALLDNAGHTWTIAQILALGPNAITATAATIGTVPSTGNQGVAITGQTGTLTPSGATGYAVLYTGSADEGSRIAFTGTALPSLTPATAASYTIRVYAALTGGTALATSASIAVAGAPATTATIGAPSGTPTTGTASTFAITANSYPVYASLKIGGTEQTPRIAVSSAGNASITPATAGTATASVYAASTGGTALATTASFAVASAPVVSPWTVRNAFSSYAFPSTYNIAGASYGPGLNFIVQVLGAGNTTPTGLIFALGASATTPPVSGAAGGDYGLNNIDSTIGGVNGPLSPGAWSNSGSLVIWKNGHATGTTRTLYLWVLPTDGTAAAVMTNSDGTPFAVTVTY